jgi:hypothetical protein
MKATEGLPTQNGRHQKQDSCNNIEAGYNMDGRQQHNMDTNSTIWSPTAHYGRKQHNIDANSTLWTPTAQYGRQQHIMDANSTIWTPTAQYGRPQHNMDANSTLWTSTAQYVHQQLISFRGNSPKSRKSGEKFVKKDVKKNKNSIFFCPIDLSSSNSYRTIGNPM